MSHRDWSRRNAILEASSIVTQFKFASPPRTPPFDASVLRHVNSRLPHCGACPWPRPSLCQEHALSVFRQAVRRVCVKMATSLRHTLLRLFPPLLRSSYVAQVKPWRAFPAAPWCLYFRPYLHYEESRGLPPRLRVSPAPPSVPHGARFLNTEPGLRVTSYSRPPSGKSTRWWGYPCGNEQFITRSLVPEVVPRKVFL